MLAFHQTTLSIPFQHNKTLIKFLFYKLALQRLLNKEIKIKRKSSMFWCGNGSIKAYLIKLKNIYKGQVYGKSLVKWNDSSKVE